MIQQISLSLTVALHTAVLSSSVHVVTPGLPFLRLSQGRAETGFMTLRTSDQPTEGENSDRKHWPPRLAGDWAWDFDPRKKRSQKVKKQQAIRWRISKRPEKWIMKYSVTGGCDP
jgi:hypothetical protein